MASMTYCVAQNCLSDLRQIITKVEENKSFSQDEASALINILGESVKLMQILDIPSNELKIIGNIHETKEVCNEK